MAQVLELAELAQHDGVAEGQLGSRRVDPQLDPQRTPLARSAGQAWGQAVGGEHLGDADAEFVGGFDELGGYRSIVCRGRVEFGFGGGWRGGVGTSLRHGALQDTGGVAVAR